MESKIEINENRMRVAINVLWRAGFNEDEIAHLLHKPVDEIVPHLLESLRPEKKSMISTVAPRLIKRGD